MPGINYSYSLSDIKAILEAHYRYHMIKQREEEARLRTYQESHDYGTRVKILTQLSSHASSMATIQRIAEDFKIEF